jgi:hypothetical protein
MVQSTGDPPIVVTGGLTARLLRFFRSLFGRIAGSRSSLWD